ncbi:B-cell receptor CD22 isoform X2 [Amia ocellicauda]|uniref:B-cell receptor CD22 isoform X2 n=1 Tax=Amia ocellicauda TaxID=2972642 RepID=UPI003464A827
MGVEETLRLLGATLLLLPGVLGGSWAAWYQPDKICAVRGSSVVLPCSYDYPATYSGFLGMFTYTYTVQTVMWCHNNRETSYVYHSGGDSISPEYRHRAEYLGNKQKDCTLKIKDIRTADRGTYRFRFEISDNGGKWAGDTGVTLSVSELQVKMSPSGVNGAAREGDAVILTCDTGSCSSTQTQITWFKNGRPISHTQTPANTLRLNPVSHADSGDYSCAVREYRETRSQGFTVDVHYAPKSISVSVSPSGKIVEGSHVTLTCSSNANPPVQRYTWFKSSDMLERKQSLFFANISSGDSGQYYCAAQNRIGTRNSPAVTVDVQYAPKDTSVSISPSGELVEGSSVTLTCSSNANPPVQRYTWFKSSDMLERKQSLFFANISSGDSGQYYCAAQNRIGTRNSPAVTVDVQYAPKDTSVSISPSGELVEGSSVTLTCSSNANPPVQRYTWFKSSDMLERKQSLFFANISSGDSGQYYCAAQNRIGTRNSPAVTVDVQYAPKDTSVSISPSGELVEGSSVTLTCSSNANPPVQRYTWFKSSDMLERKQSLFFANISSGDSGQYYCAAQNRIGTHNSPAVTVDVKYAPKSTSVSVSPSGEIVEGSPVTLTCSSNANPPVQRYTWFNSSGDAVWEKGSGQSFTIVETSSVDSGQYYCEAHNRIGAHHSQAVTVDVQYAPKNTSLSISPSGKIVEGSPYTLTCSSNANPPVQRYTWFKSSDMLEKKQSLFFANISSGDSGKYFCKAQNRIGAHHSPAVTVDVQYAPKNTSVSISPFGEIVEGSPVTLTCSSNAKPPVQRYTWFKSSGAAVWEKGSGQSFTISNFSSGDSGQYNCEAQNRIGTHNSPAVTVDIQYAPKDTSVSISPSGEIVEGSPVTLTCSSNANPPVQRYSWFQSSGTAVREKGSGQSFTISNFSYGDSGQYYCEAHNKHGAHSSTAVPLTITAEWETVLLPAVLGSALCVCIVTAVILVCVRRRKAGRPVEESNTGTQSPPSDPHSDIYTALDIRAVSAEYDTLKFSQHSASNTYTALPSPAQSSEYETIREVTGGWTYWGQKEMQEKL